MSLINEALKRAQSQKSAPPPAAGSPPAGSPPPPPPTPVGTPVPGIITLLLVGGTILAVFTLGAGLIIWGLRSDRGPIPEPVRVAAEMPVAPAAPAPPAAILAEPPPPPPPSPSPSPSPFPSLDERREAPPQEDSSPFAAPPPPVLPPAIAPIPAPPGVPSPPPATGAATVAATAPSAPVSVPGIERPAPQPEPPPPAPPAPPAPPQPDPAILGFLSEIEIRGIMAGLQRVLIFNPADNRSSAFEAGAVFSRDPLLTIKEIRQRSIIFEDENGLRYEKRF